MNLEQQLTAFKQQLKLADRSANTIAAYVGEGRLFARWFEKSTGCGLRWVTRRGGRGVTRYTSARKKRTPERYSAQR